MSDNKGLSDQELLKLCQSGGPVTNAVCQAPETGNKKKKSKMKVC